MDFVIIGLVALAASALTLFSGFGLGTLLLPAFVFFFPVPVAVAITGAVHLTTSLFKGALLWREADWLIVARFAGPAIPAAIAGAWLLGELGSSSRLFSWSLSGREFGPNAAGALVGFLMLLFALLELQARFRSLAAPPRLLPLGGLITGFFGGLTGQQGAFRSMFLLKSNLEASSFIATGAISAVLVDLSRVPTYAANFARSGGSIDTHGFVLMACATACALAGSLLGMRYARKVTIAAVRGSVAIVMVLVGAALMTGLLGS